MASPPVAPLETSGFAACPIIGHRRRVGERIGAENQRTGLVGVCPHADRACPPMRRCYKGRPRGMRWVERGSMDKPHADTPPVIAVGGTSGHDANFLALTLGSVGVVYGDIGTSP